MERRVYSNSTNKLLRIEDAVPVCGEYCDTCGDCLSCFGGDPCYDGMNERGEHFWVAYEEEAPAASPQEGGR